MSTINTNIEIKHSEFMGYDTCSLCPFLEVRFDKNPCRCKIFNKYPERFNPVEKYGLEHYKYIRLQECKDSEVK